MVAEQGDRVRRSSRRWRRCCSSLDLSKYDLSRLRYVTNAGAGIADRARRAACGPRCRTSQLYLMYGQTECLRSPISSPREVDRAAGLGRPRHAEPGGADRRRGRAAGRAERRRRAGRARLARDARLLGAAGGDRSKAAARPAPWRARALHRRPLPAGRGGLSLLRRPAGRHHQVARARRSVRAKSRTCSTRSPEVLEAAVVGRARSACSGRPSRRGRAQAEGAAWTRATCSATAPAPRRLHGAVSRRVPRASCRRTNSGKIRQAS